MMLEVRGLTIVRPDGTALLGPLDFELAPGESLGIVGESGSGKTLATRAIPGLLPPGVAVAAGSIALDSVELTAATEAELRSIRGKHVGLVFQEPMTSLNPALNVGDQLAEGMRLHTDHSDAEIRAACIAMLERVRITNAANALERFPHEFSGGMRQRIMLASVLLLKPRLLIADEPTTALDVLSQREVLEIMAELTRELGTGLLLITHDLGLVARYTERVLVLENGAAVETGATAEVLAAPKHPYTQRLLASLPRRREGVAAQAQDAPLLEIDGLAVDYPGKRDWLGRARAKRVVTGVSLTVGEGEILALVGASGSGKTTLGRAALGLLPTAEGDVLFDGTSLTAMDQAQRAAFRRDAQLIFQDPYSSLDPRMRIAQIVAAPLRQTEFDRTARRERTQAMLEAVDLGGFGERYPHQLSGGQRQRVAIARALVSEPRLVVADEPVSALDLTIQRQILDILQRLQRERSFACLFITHDLAVVEQIADRVVVLESGRIVEQGSVAAIFAAPAHPYTRELLAATPVLDLIAAE